MAKSSESGVVDSKTGRNMNVQNEEAALPANVAAPVWKIPKIQIYMMIAVMILAILWSYDAMLVYIALPYAATDPPAREHIFLFGSIDMGSIDMGSIMKFLLLVLVIFIY